MLMDELEQQLADCDRQLTLAERQLDKHERIRSRLAAGGFETTSQTSMAASGEEDVQRRSDAERDVALAAMPVDRREVARRRRLVGKLGEALATTLEFEDTLNSIAQLVVTHLADLCIINLIDDDGVARPVKVFCRDPKRAWVCDALMRTPPGRQQAPVAQLVLEKKRSALITHVTADLIRSWAVSEDQLHALRSIAPKSAITVPLMVQGRLLGALSLLASDMSRPYDRTDLRFAEAIARRAAFFLENARLYRAAKRAAQARDDLLGVVAHDLRNPLTVIRTLAAYLRHDGGEDGPVGEEIEHAAVRMNRLIQDLLDITRLEANRFLTKPERVNVLDIMRDVLAIETPLASLASIELRFDEPSDTPDVWADRDRLVQIFDNLIGSAVKFTKPGGGIALGAIAHAGEVRFHVEDTGCGIAADQVPHVFDRFWQAPGAARRGAGLGLTIVKGIVEAHGGHVWVRSEPAQGSTFFFTIPTAA